MTTVAAALAAARKGLHGAGIEDADLEAEVLLRHALALDRAHLYQRLSAEIGNDSVTFFDGLVRRRLGHEPSAYITGHREFYGLDFAVSPDVLIPRPETETLVEAALELARSDVAHHQAIDVTAPRRAAPAQVEERLDETQVLIADIGTGSGAVAVSLAVHLPRARVMAIDSSPAALALASQNARRHSVDASIDFRSGDLLEPLDEPVDLIVANLPYVKTMDWFSLPAEIRDHEPRAALDGGPDGLVYMRPLIEAAPRYLKDGGALALEFGAGQQNALLAIAQGTFTSVVIRPDLAGRPRVLIARN